MLLRYKDLQNLTIAQIEQYKRLITEFEQAQDSNSKKLPVNIRDAYLIVAQCYEFGHPKLARNTTTANEYYNKIALKNALGLLGLLRTYQTLGKACPEVYLTKLQLILKKAERNEFREVLKIILGVLHLYGLGGFPRQPETAKKLLQSIENLPDWRVAENILKDWDVNRIELEHSPSKKDSNDDSIEPDWSLKMKTTDSVEIRPSEQKISLDIMETEMQVEGEQPDPKPLSPLNFVSEPIPMPPVDLVQDPKPIAPVHPVQLVQTKQQVVKPPFPFNSVTPKGVRIRSSSSNYSKGKAVSLKMQQRKPTQVNFAQFVLKPKTADSAPMNLSDILPSNSKAEAHSNFHIDLNSEKRHAELVMSYEHVDELSIEEINTYYKIIMDSKKEDLLEVISSRSAAEPEAAIKAKAEKIQDACFIYGQCLEYGGRNINRDLNKAYEYYLKIAQYNFYAKLFLLRVCEKIGKPYPFNDMQSLIDAIFKTPKTIYNKKILDYAEAVFECFGLHCVVNNDAKNRKEAQVLDARNRRKAQALLQSIDSSPARKLLQDLKQNAFDYEVPHLYGSSSRDDLYTFSTSLYKRPEYQELLSKVQKKNKLPSKQLIDFGLMLELKCVEEQHPDLIRTFEFFREAAKESLLGADKMQILNLNEDMAISCLLAAHRAKILKVHDLGIKHFDKFLVALNEGVKRDIPIYQYYLGWALCHGIVGLEHNPVEGKKLVDAAIKSLKPLEAKAAKLIAEAAALKDKAVKLKNANDNKFEAEVIALLARASELEVEAETVFGKCKKELLKVLEKFDEVPAVASIKFCLKEYKLISKRTSKGNNSDLMEDVDPYPVINSLLPESKIETDQPAKKVSQKDTVLDNNDITIEPLLESGSFSSGTKYNAKKTTVKKPKNTHSVAMDTSEDYAEKVTDSKLDEQNKLVSTPKNVIAKAQEGERMEKSRPPLVFSQKLKNANPNGKRSAHERPSEEFIDLKLNQRKKRAKIEK